MLHEVAKGRGNSLPRPCLCLVNDDLLGVLVEEVHPRGIDGDLNCVAGLRGRTGGNTGDQVDLVAFLVLAGLEVEIDLRAHQLSELDVGIDRRVGKLGQVKRLVVQQLGTQRADDLFAYVVLEAFLLGLFLRHRPS